MTELTTDEKIIRLTDAMTKLAALVAPEDAPDPDFDAAPDTPFVLVVEFSDGRVEQLEKVAEFHLIDRRTGVWPTGLAYVEEVEGNDPVVGGWDHEGTFRKHDDRRLSRRPGW